MGRVEGGGGGCDVVALKLSMLGRQKVCTWPGEPDAELKDAADGLRVSD